MNNEDQRRRIATMVADAIRAVLKDSDELQELLREASDDGYDVLLSVFSGIMVRRRESEHEKGEQRQPLPITFEFSDFDKQFLKSVGIQVPTE